MLQTIEKNILQPHILQTICGTKMFLILIDLLILLEKNRLFLTYATNLINLAFKYLKLILN